ncbi:meiosis regulator and mRNA stability factor 1-like [Centruroides sculpturatus]|uniref:meiosis regulator and mRNA stability factor 1-like n=1 Tax=Centruroides sculpturatus TaxID=218467 RepID=UPI000C6E441B|nr:meiosis regulator and mRNA stability factor 1-like [Centruroides sculpturatus]
MAEMNKRNSPRNNIAAKFQNVSLEALPPIGVFWDIENCQVPKGKSVIALVQAIRERFFRGHREAEFLCVCDINKENKEVIQELNLAQVTVVHINATSKNAADDKLKQCMRRFVDTHGMPATILLISGDVNFATHLSDFHHRDNIHIILLHPNHTPEPLLVCAHEHFYFHELTINLPTRNSSKVRYITFDESGHILIFFYVVYTDLINKEKLLYNEYYLNLLQCNNYILNSNFQLTRRPPVMAFSDFTQFDIYHSTTLLIIYSKVTQYKKYTLHNELNTVRGWPSLVVSLAKKRMDREDVFGKKITVSYFQSSTSGDECADYNSQKQYQNRQKMYKNRRHCVSSSSSCNSSPVSQTGIDNEAMECVNTQNDLPILKTKVEFPPPPNIMEDSASRKNVDKCSERIASERSDKLNSLVCDTQDSKSFKWSSYQDQNINDISPASQANGVSETGNRLSQKNVGRVSPFLMVDCTSKSGFQFSSISRSDSNIYNSQNTIVDNYNVSTSSITNNFNNYNSNSPIFFSPFSNNSDYQNQMGWHSPTLSLGDSAHPVGRASPIVSSTSSSPVELLVTNLDQNIEANEMKKILLSVFREHIMVLHISMLLQPDGSLKAVVKVPSLQDAQYAISQLHRRKIGFKRLLISYVATDRSPPLYILRSEVVALLMDIPSKRLPLFKFREIFERRYHRSISVSELYKMKDAVSVVESSMGRMVCLNSDFRYTPSPTDSESSQEVQQILEKPYCEHHFHVSESLGWAEQDSVYPLPNVQISLKTLAPRVHTLLDTHQGSLPLNSFCLCYLAEFGPLPIIENVESKLSQETSAVSSDVDGGNENCQQHGSESQGVGKGVPLEHLIACIPGVQITKSVLAIKKIQWLENKPSEQEYSGRKDQPRVVLKPTTTAYCADALPFTLPEPLFILHFQNGFRYNHVASSEEETIIGIPKREQTPEEIERTKQFAAEVIELFRHVPNCSMPFSKFIPAYHHHFGKQCRVSDYGFSKLIELFEAIPDVLEVCGIGEEKVLMLTEQEKLKVLADRLVSIVRSSPQQCILLDKLISIYANQHGYSLRCQEFGASDIPDLISKLRSSLKIQFNEKPLVVLVDRGFVHLVSLRIRRLLMETTEGKLKMEKLSKLYKERFGQHINIMNMKQDLEDVIKVEEGVVKLIPLLMLFRDILILLHENGGQLPLQNFESLFLKRFGVPCRPAQYGFPSIATMFNSQPDYFVIRGRRSKRIIMVNRETAGSPLPPVLSRDIHNCGDDNVLKKRKSVKMDCLRKDCDLINKVQTGELLQMRNSPVDLLCQPIPSGVPSPEIQPEKQSFPDRDLMRFESPLPIGQDVMTEMSENECLRLKTPPLCLTSVVPSPVQTFQGSVKGDGTLAALFSENRAFSAPPPPFARFAAPPGFGTPSATPSFPPTYQTVFQSPPAFAYLASPPVHSSSFEAPRQHPLASSPTTALPSVVSFGSMPSSLSPTHNFSFPVHAGCTPSFQRGSSVANLLASEERERLSSDRTRSDFLSYEDLTETHSSSTDNSLPSTQSTPTRGSAKSRPRSRIAAHFTTPIKSNGHL